MSKTKDDPKPGSETMHALSPHLVCDGAADAIDFYERTFGATEKIRVPGPVATHVRDMAEDEVREAAKQAICGQAA